jgi:single-strand DNA-binding protein
MNLNKVFIIGRVTADIVLKATASNTPVTSFSVATDRTWTDKTGARQKEAEFHNVVAWGRQAEVASQFLGKGSLVLIEGRLQTRTWQDSNNQNRRTTEIICERLQLGPRSGGGAPAQAGGGYQPASRPAAKSAAQEQDIADEIPEEIPDISLDDEIKPEDLPF